MMDRVLSAAERIKQRASSIPRTTTNASTPSTGEVSKCTQELRQPTGVFEYRSSESAFDPTVSSQSWQASTKSAADARRPQRSYLNSNVDTAQTPTTDQCQPHIKQRTSSVPRATTNESTPSTGEALQHVREARAVFAHSSIVHLRTGVAQLA